MKAGGASVALDIKQPVARLKAIIDQVKPSIILCSAGQKATADHLGKSIAIVIDTAFIEKISPPEVTQRLPTISSSSPLYLIFTSGSTGIPKGVVVTHTNFASAIRHQNKALGWSEKSRVLDFASYSFDVAWATLLRTLCAGGCICIPSEHDRQHNVAEAMKRLGVTQASFTPTVARLLQPSDLPTLEILRFGGEALQAADIARWGPNVRLMNCYGPAECTPVSTVSYPDSRNGSTLGIGHGFGGMFSAFDTQMRSM